MAALSDENSQFVHLIEELKDILEKSQVPSAKKRKEEAATMFIEKWKESTGKELMQHALFKKITNLKVRAKSALNKGAQLSPWQSKLLEISQDDTIGNQPDRADGPKHESKINEEADIVTEFEVIAEAPTNFLSQFETEDTRALTNQQLQRIVLLQQIKILALQQKKLENEINDPNPILLDISAFNSSNILNINDNQ